MPSNPHSQIPHFPLNGLFCPISPKQRQIIVCSSLRRCKTECINSWDSICIFFAIYVSSHSCRPLRQITVMGTWPYVSCSTTPCPSATDNSSFDPQYMTEKYSFMRMFLMFLKEVSYAHQGCIYLIKNTVKTVE